MTACRFPSALAVERQSWNRFWLLTDSSRGRTVLLAVMSDVALAGMETPEKLSLKIAVEGCVSTYYYRYTSRDLLQGYLIVVEYHIGPNLRGR